MKQSFEAMRKSGILLGLFALVSVFFVVSTNIITKDAIEKNDRERLLKTINEIVSVDDYDNDISTSKVTLFAENSGLEQDAIVYIATKKNKPSYALFSITTYRAYNVIYMLIGVKLEDQSLAGVRVVSHTETPGLGDKIETKKSDWILVFEGKSINNPKLSDWAVKKDGGIFDQFTGATITPRSIVNMVRSVLLYSQDNLDDFVQKSLIKLSEGKTNE